MMLEYIDHKGEKHKMLTRATDTVTGEKVVVYKDSSGEVLTKPLVLFNGYTIVDGKKVKSFRAIT